MVSIHSLIMTTDKFNPLVKSVAQCGMFCNVQSSQLSAPILHATLNLYLYCIDCL